MLQCKESFGTGATWPYPRSRRSWTVHNTKSHHCAVVATSGSQNGYVVSCALRQEHTQWLFLCGAKLFRLTAMARGTSKGRVSRSSAGVAARALRSSSTLSSKQGVQKRITKPRKTRRGGVYTWKAGIYSQQRMGTVYQQNSSARLNLCFFRANRCNVFTDRKTNYRRKLQVRTRQKDQKRLRTLTKYSTINSLHKKTVEKHSVEKHSNSHCRSYMATGWRQASAAVESERNVCVCAPPQLSYKCTTLISGKLRS